MRERVIAIATACLVIISADGLAQSVLRLREPNGTYSVGRRTLVLTDSAREERATPQAGDKRDLVINIWYPIARTPVVGSPYMPQGAKYRGVMSDEVVDAWERTVAPVLVDASPARGRFPILLFSHGWSSRAASSSIWLAEMASHGFTAVGVDHPYLGVVATSGPVATAAQDEHFASPLEADRFYADDLAFVRAALARLDSTDPILRGAIDTQTVFASGHSSGHAAASAFAALYPGVKALISFDAGISRLARERPFAVPFLLVRAENPTYTGVFVREPGSVLRANVYDSSLVQTLTRPFFDLQLLGTAHTAVMDRTSSLEGPNASTVQLEHELIARYTLMFLKSVMTGTPAMAVAEADRSRVRLRRVVVGVR